MAFTHTHPHTHTRIHDVSIHLASPETSVSFIFPAASSEHFPFRAFSDYITFIFEWRNKSKNSLIEMENKEKSQRSD